MPFQVIDTEDSAWDAIVSRHADPDIFFTSFYARTQRNARAAVYKDGLGTIIKPFSMRPIYGASLLFDVTSFYGYGGAIVSGGMASGSSLEKSLGAAFSRWCIEHRVVSEFCLYHPLYGPTPDTATRKRVVVLDTDGDLLAPMRSDKRQNIQRAYREGVGVGEIAADMRTVRQFHDLYSLTMDRVHAGDRWRFSVMDLFKLAVLPGSRLFFACIAGEVEVASLMLSHSRTAYYHLTGNRMANPRARANDLLVYSIMQWCKSNKIERLHLGGGVTSKPDDPLLAWKSGFGGRLYDVHSSFTIHDRPAYDQLCQKAAERLGARFTQSDFEPAYRRKAA